MSSDVVVPEDGEKLPAKDKAGHPLTDYTSSKFSPERQKLLNRAEVDYVNGIDRVGEDGRVGTYFPSQREIAERHNLPENLIADQATKNHWAKRRKLVQHKQSVYDLTKRIKDRRDRADKLQTALVENLERVQALNAYQVWELEQRMQAEIKRYTEAQEAGEDYLPDAGIRNADVEALSRTADHISKSRDRIIREIDRQDKEAIEQMALELEAPAPLPAVADEARIQAEAAAIEKAVRDEAKARGVSETELSAIWQEMQKIQALNQSNAERAASKLIQGELAGEDEEDE